MGLCQSKAIEEQVVVVKGSESQYDGLEEPIAASFDWRTEKYGRCLRKTINV